MTYFLINLGNTNTVLARAIDGVLVGQLKLPTATMEKFADLIHSFLHADNREPAAEISAPSIDDKPVAYLASVVPAANKILKKIIHHNGDGVIGKIIEINPLHHSLIAHRLDTPATTGVDRLLAALAAYSLPEINRKKEATLIIQAGTATTVDIVDKDGVFCGGLIMPGAQMWLSALRQAAQLPKLSATQIEWKNKHAGTNTAAAILNGASAGLVGAVREAVRRLLMQLSSAGGQIPIIVITGGWGEVLLEYFPAHYDADLVLRGLNYWVQKNGELRS